MSKILILFFTLSTGTCREDENLKMDFWHFLVYLEKLKSVFI